MRYHPRNRSSSIIPGHRANRGAKFKGTAATNRRGAKHLAFVLCLAALAALSVPASASAANAFIDGVTAGEVTDHTATVWGQTNHAAQVKAQVATDRLFNHVVRERLLTANDLNDDTVQTKFGGFTPFRTYHYRFCYPGGPCSDRGSFLTAPSASDNQVIRFAYSGDETGVSAELYWGNFKAFQSMVNEHNNFNIDFGDTIYSDPEVPGAPTALGVAQKWAMYRKKLAIPNMRLARAATGMYNHWDDHEFINDFSTQENTFTTSNGGVVNIPGRTLYNRGVRAFRNYEPSTFSQERGLYRTFRWGKNLQLFFLDERSFRSAKASANHTCDNPDTGQPDLAPTAPQSTRNAFAQLIPSLSQPVSQACKNRINNPNRTFLGAAQLSRFISQLKASTARWKVVMNETPIQQFYALPYDRWEGYAYERVRLLNALKNAHINHLVFLTTDTHAGLANIVRYRTLQNDVAPSNAPATAPSNTPYHDFVIGPVATKPFWQEIDDTTGAFGSGYVISSMFFKPPPPFGMGMACAQGAQNSYAEVTATSTTLTVAYKGEDGNTLFDADGSTPCGPYVLTN